LPATNAKRLRKGAKRRSNPSFFLRRDGLLRFARKDVERVGVGLLDRPWRFEPCLHSGLHAILLIGTPSKRCVATAAMSS